MLLILTGKREIGPSATEFIRSLGENLAKNGTPYSVASFQDVEVYLSDAEIHITVSGQPVETWSTIYPRKVGQYMTLAHILASYSKIHGITVIDRFRERNSETTKLKQMYLFATKKLGIPKTYHCALYDPGHIANAISFLGLPVVVKQCGTSKGIGVALAHDAGELERKIAVFLEKNPKKEIILQEFIENTFEYRIFVTGNTIATAERKTRTAEETFRNNVSIGAIEDFFDPSLLDESVASTALGAAKELDVQVAGVDIVVDKNGRALLFEVNSCPGFTLDEAVSDEVRRLSDYLTVCEKK